MQEKLNTDELLQKLERLNHENERLKRILSAHGISYEQNPSPKDEEVCMACSNADNQGLLSKEQILQQRKDLFRSLFKGREDVFALRWTSRDGSKSGYMPACSNRWTSLCDRKKYKCANCPNRQFVALGNAEIYKHLCGVDKWGKPFTIGVYAILSDDTCNFLCADFDDKNCEHGYKKDVLAFVSVCKDWDIPYSIERSRSGNGAHVWILFEQPVAAGKARRMGNAVLTEAMNRDGQISFKSYDRFFPNQDHLPEGGFGNLVALPLQGLPRKKGNSVFVDDHFEQYPDQWEYLRTVKKLSAESLETLLKLHANQSDFGELSKTSERKPWETPVAMNVTKDDLPAEITVVKSNMLYIPIKGLSSKVINHLKRIASFKNPEFGAKLGMHLSTYNVPRIISCADVSDDWLGLPRGCEDALVEFFDENSVGIVMEDKTNHGHTIDVSFSGTLRPEQEAAVSQLMPYDNGILSGIAAFSKIVASLLAELIKPLCKHVIVLTGSTSAKEKKNIELQLKAVSPAEPMVIVASLKYISEGFDLPRLDTLFLAQPVSYKGLVAQYTGRLHRDCEGKTDVQVYDYVDIRQPMCETMYKRRLRGYAAVGYKVRPHQTNPSAPSDMIYDGGTFVTAFLADISNARHSIVIACPMIRIYRHTVIIQKLMEQQANGVSIYVHIKKEGYDEERFREVGGTYSVSDTQTIQCAIIDKSICWYGDINFLGYHSADNTVMRIDDAKMAGELLDMMSNK